MAADLNGGAGLSRPSRLKGADFASSPRGDTPSRRERPRRRRDMSSRDSLHHGAALRSMTASESARFSDIQETVVREIARPAG